MGNVQAMRELNMQYLLDTKVDLNTKPEKLSDLDKQYLELERQQHQIREQAKLIRDQYG